MIFGIVRMHSPVSGACDDGDDDDDSNDGRDLMMMMAKRAGT